jgi:predicted phosphoribosyltransferase
MEAMTTREKAEQVLKGLPEEQVPVALEALEAVERDARVLKMLRERDPQKSERELMEDLAVIKEGDEAIERIGERFADVDPEEIEREAVKAVREVRQERAAERRAAG